MKGELLTSYGGEVVVVRMGVGGRGDVHVCSYTSFVGRVICVSNFSNSYVSIHSESGEVPVHFVLSTVSGSSFIVEIGLGFASSYRGFSGGIVVYSEVVDPLSAVLVSRYSGIVVFLNLSRRVFICVSGRAMLTVCISASVYGSCRFALGTVYWGIRVWAVVIVYLSWAFVIGAELRLYFRIQVLNMLFCLFTNCLVHSPVGGYLFSGGKDKLVHM